MGRSGRRKTSKVSIPDPCTPYRRVSDLSRICILLDHTGLQRVRDKLLADMQELNKNKPRGKADDLLLAEITRLEPALAVARDDLVCAQQSLALLSQR